MDSARTRPITGGMSTPALVALALIAVVLAYAGFLIKRRRRNDLRLRRHQRALTRAEPFALGLIDGDLVLPAAEDALALREVLTGLAPALTGESREAIAAYFLSSGELDAAVAALGVRQWPRRAEAAAALGDMCHPSAAAPLTGALGDPSPAVRLAAARSLGRLGAAEAVDALIESLVHHTVPEAVVRVVLVDIGPAAVPGLRGLLRDPDPARAGAAADMLAELGSTEDAEAIGSLLAHAVADVRARACRALGQLGDERPAAGVAALLEDPEMSVRAAAADALGAIGDRSHAAALVCLAQAAGGPDAAAAAEALARVAPDLAARVGAHPAASRVTRYAADSVLDERG